MDRAEAKRLLRLETAAHERRTYGDLVRLVGDVEAYEIVGADGIGYQLELEAHWVGPAGGPIQVLIGIDDGSLRGSLRPMTDGFVKGPEEPPPHQ